jgi:hypothetical protein
MKLDAGAQLTSHAHAGSSFELFDTPSSQGGIIEKSEARITLNMGSSAQPREYSPLMTPLP